MKNRNWKTRMAALLLGLLLLALSLATPASAAQTQAEIEAELKKIEQRIKEQEKVIADLKGQQADQAELLEPLNQKMEDIQAKTDLIDAEIARLDTSISAIKVKVDALNVKIAQCEARIAEIDEKTAAKNAEIKGMQAQLMENLSEQYMNGPASNLQLLLSSADLADLLTAAEYINRKAERDAQLREVLEEEMALLRELQAQQAAEQAVLEENKTQLQTESAVLVEQSLKQRDARGELEGQQAEITAMQREIFGIIDNLKEQTAASQKIIAKEEKAREEFDRKLDELLASKLSSGEISSNVSNDGKMIWPFPYKDCYITSQFGATNGRSHAHRGLDISIADKSKNYQIIAALDGVIVDHGYHSSMGNYVMILHGYYAPTGKYIKTTYMHLKSFSSNVVDNKEVKAGTSLGYMGSTGNSTGPHLHFQVNEFSSSAMTSSTAVNPLKYVSNPYK